MRISDLPNTVLSRIFVESYDPVKTPDFPTVITQVSRQFRNVALDRPELWATLTNAQPPVQTRTYIERSKTSKLTVFITVGERVMVGHSHDSRHPLADFLDLVVPTASRWKDLRIHGLNSKERTESDGSALSRLEGLSFPSLETLHMPQFRGRTDIPNADFSAQWRMPCLVEFAGLDLGPHPDWGHTILSLTLNLVNAEDFKWDQMLQALHNCPHLEKLHFDIAKSYKLDHSGPPTTLSKLMCLSVEVRQASKPAGLASIFRAIDAPALFKLSVTVDLPWKSSPAWTTRQRRERTPLPRTSMSPESCVVRISDQVGYEEPSDTVLEYVLASVAPQRLRHLSIEGGTWLLEKRVRKCIPGTLHTLRFKQCPRLAFKELRMLFTDKNSQINTKNIKELDIEDCGVEFSAPATELRSLLGDRLKMSLVEPWQGKFVSHSLPPERLKCNPLGLSLATK